MPDITMCQDHDCPKAKRCYRSDLVTMASPMMQSYFCGSPRVGKTCKMFDPMDGLRRGKRKVREHEDH